MGDQRFISARTHILGNVQLREDFELSADFINLDAPASIPISNTQSIRYLCVREENFIIPDKINTGVELRYYEQDEYHSLDIAQKDGICECRNHNKKCK